MLLVLLLLLGFFSFGAIPIAELPQEGVTPDIATMECQLAGGVCPTPVASIQSAICCPIDVQLPGAEGAFAAGGASFVNPDASGVASECATLVVPSNRNQLTLDLDAFGCARWSLLDVAAAEGDEPTFAGNEL